MKKKLFKIFGVLFILWCIISIVIAWYLSTMIIIPNRRGLTENHELVAWDGSTDPDKFPIPKDITIQGSDKVDLKGWYFEQEVKKDCAVILLHGWSSIRTETPVFIIHSKSDKATDSSQSDHISKILDPSRSLFVNTVWGARHAKDITTRPQEYRNLVYGFLEKYVDDSNYCQRTE